MRMSPEVTFVVSDAKNIYCRDLATRGRIVHE